MHLAIRQAAAGDTPVISDILLEAAHWLQREGAPMWRDDEVTPERIASDVSVGSFYLAESAGEAIGTLKFQLSDPIFCPMCPQMSRLSFTALRYVGISQAALRRRRCLLGPRSALMRLAVVTCG